MKIDHESHLSYCTNIHPGETWESVFNSLKEHVPAIKAKLTSQSFGLGLRLSALAAGQLRREGTSQFKDWLDQNDLYIFTMNGFPYGGFHHQRVKDQVHHPDWTTSERLKYTITLFELLADLLPNGLSGGISTSPLSYGPWHTGDTLKEIKTEATRNLIAVVERLNRFNEEQGIIMHLDLEPEPDGLLENSQQTLDYFHQWLLPIGTKILCPKLGISNQRAEEMILKHIGVCYDVCHFAVVFQKPQKVIEQFKSSGINIGKFQLSAALKKDFSGQHSLEEVYRYFASLDEPTYLHQVVARKPNGELESFRDLSQALPYLQKTAFQEWRTHFHVPVFESSYGVLQSTQQDIIETLKVWSQGDISRHLEVETYTWGVLPKSLRRNLNNSIARELQWVLAVIGDQHA